MTSARERFLRSKTDAKGISVDAHLRQIAKTAPGLVNLALPPIPETLVHIWNWYCDASSGREPGQALSWMALDAWSRLTGIVLRPYEVRLLRRLDLVWLEVMRG